MPTVLSTIFQEVRDNNLAAVTQIISTSPHLVHARDEEDSTPLHESAFYGFQDLCSLLLRHGAEVDAVVPVYGTPLMFAVQENHGEVCSILLSHGANVNYIRSSDGLTLLHESALRKKLRHHQPTNQLWRKYPCRRPLMINIALWVAGKEEGNIWKGPLFNVLLIIRTKLV